MDTHCPTCLSKSWQLQIASAAKNEDRSKELACVGLNIKMMNRGYSWAMAVSPKVSVTFLLQDPGERSDCGGGRDQFGGSHSELCRLCTKEHLRNRQVRFNSCDTNLATPVLCWLTTTAAWRFGHHWNTKQPLGVRIDCDDFFITEPHLPSLAWKLLFTVLRFMAKHLQKVGCTWCLVLISRC